MNERYEWEIWTRDIILQIHFNQRIYHNSQNSVWAYNHQWKISFQIDVFVNIDTFNGIIVHFASPLSWINCELIDTQKLSKEQNNREKRYILYVNGKVFISNTINVSEILAKKSFVFKRFWLQLTSILVQLLFYKQIPFCLIKYVIELKISRIWRITY